jgi:hypothetical protein
MDLQSKSPIFTKLPGELRNAIYALALTSQTAITDPSNPPCKSGLAIATYHHNVPSLGIPLQRTCKRIYYELCTYPLYSSNNFRFTSATSAHRFLTSLSNEQAAQIRDVEIDLTEVSDRHPSVEREWVQYMCWETEKSTNGIWAKKIGGLRIDAPSLKTMRLNIEEWQRTETLKGVALLRDLLQDVQGLERVVVTGTDGRALLAGVKNKYLEVWGPVLFVGVMRFARLAGVVQWMSKCLSGEGEEQVVRWSRGGRTVTLEIMTWSFFVKETGSVTFDSFESLGVDEGCCSLTKYEQRWHSRNWPNASP